MLQLHLQEKFSPIICKTTQVLKVSPYLSENPQSHSTNQNTKEETEADLSQSIHTGALANYNLDLHPEAI